MKSIVKILLRISALFFVYRIILLINSFINYMGSVIGVIDGHDGPDYRYFIFLFILYLAVGIALWVFNDQITGIIIHNEDATENLQINITYNQFMNITMKIFGIVLVLNSIEPALVEILNMITIHLNILYTPHRSYYIIALLDPTIKIAVGLVLIFKKDIFKKE